MIQITDPNLQYATEEGVVTPTNTNGSVQSHSSLNVNNTVSSMEKTVAILKAQGNIKPEQIQMVIDSLKTSGVLQLENPTGASTNPRELQDANTQILVFIAELEELKARREVEIALATTNRELYLKDIDPSDDFVMVNSINEGYSLTGGPSNATSTNRLLSQGSVVFAILSRMANIRMPVLSSSDMSLTDTTTYQNWNISSFINFRENRYERALDGENFVYSNANEIGTGSTSSSIYTYPKRVQNFIVLKNPTNADITINDLGVKGSSYGSYSCTGAGIFTPNKTNLQIANGDLVTEIQYDMLVRHTSNNGNRNYDVDGIVVPANKTVILMIWSHARYYTTGSSMIFLTMHLGFNNLKSTLRNSGVECDFKITERLMNRDLSFENATLLSLWNTTEGVNTTSKIAYGTEDEFSDNTTAIAGGKIAGEFYTNTTTGAITKVLA